MLQHLCGSIFSPGKFNDCSNNCLQINLEIYVGLSGIYIYIDINKHKLKIWILSSLILDEVNILLDRVLQSSREIDLIEAILSQDMAQVTLEISASLVSSIR